MKDKSGRTLSERVGSTFENGFGDEGWLAKSIHAVIMAGLIGLSGIIFVLSLPVLAWKGLKRLLGRKS